MKDLSDANRSVNRLKQTDDVGIHTHAVPLDNLGTAAVSDAALGLGLTLVRPGEDCWWSSPHRDSL